MKVTLKQLSYSLCLMLLVGVLGLGTAVPVSAAELMAAMAEDSDVVTVSEDEIVLNESSEQSEALSKRDEGFVTSQRVEKDATTQEEVPFVESSLTVASSLVITEIQTRGVGGANDERIVLFNASETELDITGWCVQYGSASGTSFSRVFV